jgi:hypothetical protein
MANSSGIAGQLASAGVSVPDVSVVHQYAMYALYFMIGVIVCAGAGYFIWKYIEEKKWNIDLKLFRKVNGVYVPIGDLKAQIQRVGKAGDTWLVVKNGKRLPRPKIWIGINKVWYCEREDGEWINFRLGDIDMQMKEAKAYYVEEDMRLQRLGIQKNLEERFVKEGFWAKYGQTIMTIIFCLLVTICLVVLFQKFDGLTKAFVSASASVEHMAQSVELMSNSIANSGLVSANSTVINLHSGG